jgi:hypothetical protein
MSTMASSHRTHITAWRYLAGTDARHPLSSIRSDRLTGRQKTNIARAHNARTRYRYFADKPTIKPITVRIM